MRWESTPSWGWQFTRICFRLNRLWRAILHNFPALRCIVMRGLLGCLLEAPDATIAAQSNPAVDLLALMSTEWRLLRSHPRRTDRSRLERIHPAATSRKVSRSDRSPIGSCPFLCLRRMRHTRYGLLSVRQTLP